MGMWGSFGGECRDARVGEPEPCIDVALSDFHGYLCVCVDRPVRHRNALSGGQVGDTPPPIGLVFMRTRTDPLWWACGHVSRNLRELSLPHAGGEVNSPFMVSHLRKTRESRWREMIRSASVLVRGFDVCCV